MFFSSVYSSIYTIKHILWYTQTWMGKKNLQHVLNKPKQQPSSTTTGINMTCQRILNAFMNGIY